MNTYRLRFPDQPTADQLIASLSSEWQGERHWGKTSESGRMDMVALGDLPAQNVDGSIQTTQEVIEGETIDVPVMSGKYHVDIISTYSIPEVEASPYLVVPGQPLHRFL